MLFRSFSTSWTGRGTVRRRDAGFRRRTCWILLCCGTSTVSVQIALHIALRFVPEAGVGARLEPCVKEGYCHDSDRRTLPFPFGWRSAVVVAGLLAATDYFLPLLMCLLSAPVLS